MKNHPRNPQMVEVACLCCKTKFMARVADRKRGWGKYCSKRCKAVKQEARTGQYANLLANGGPPERMTQAERDEDECWAAAEAGWDGHKGWT